LIFSI